MHSRNITHYGLTADNVLLTDLRWDAMAALNDEGIFSRKLSPKRIQWISKEISTPCMFTVRDLDEAGVRERTEAWTSPGSIPHPEENCNCNIRKFWRFFQTKMCPSDTVKSMTSFTEVRDWLEQNNAVACVDMAVCLQHPQAGPAPRSRRG
jgi:hypothetical protein